VKKVLVVILNKDNAEGLRETLNSLVNQVGSCSVCECFDVLVIDGGSKDNSAETVREFTSKYPCIKFKVQEVLGGVGPARLEVVKYAMSNGYEYIIWGDSENIYREDYVSKIIKVPTDCDVVSGKPLLRCHELSDKLFFWYHAYHVLFKYVRERHAPGNNKLVKTHVYLKSIYPPIIRSDDFYFSILALKKGVRFCYNEDAVVVVAVPKDWRGIKSWQRSRLLGLVQGAILTNRKLPPDFIPWFVFSLYPIYLMTALYLIAGVASFLGYLLLTIMLIITSYMIIKLSRLSRDVCMENKLFNGFLGFMGMYIHSLFTVYYTLRYLIKYLKTDMKEQFIRKSRKILDDYGFNLERTSTEISISS